MNTPIPNYFISYIYIYIYYKLNLKLNYKIVQLYHRSALGSTSLPSCSPSPANTATKATSFLFLLFFLSTWRKPFSLSRPSKQPFLIFRSQWTRSSPQCSKKSASMVKEAVLFPLSAPNLTSLLLSNPPFGKTSSPSPLFGSRHETLSFLALTMPRFNALKMLRKSVLKS